MRAVAGLRTAVPVALLSVPAASCRSRPCHLLTRGGTPFRLPCSPSCSPSMATPPAPSWVSASSGPAPGSYSSPPVSLEKQFEDFRVQLDETASVRERIRAVVMEMEAAVRLMNARLLLVHHSLPNPDVLEKARAQAGVLKGLFGRLAEILRECPGQYYKWAYCLWRVGNIVLVVLLLEANSRYLFGIDSMGTGGVRLRRRFH
ncbi:hypothetical protein BHE74_00018231 [Ensete ventricosum]|nr:hypothetical protein GW17_00005375 [Ensete ventricosum]RWW73847.1 hypothetical protein BHE74_00018231 [Ensete ventricosum]RZR98278.1 hypothetical protein BHM03_00027591 [Ensete ventricosum]